MLKSVLNRNIVLAGLAGCPADNHARQLAQIFIRDVGGNRNTKMKIIRQFDVFEKTSDYIKEEIPITDFDIEVVRGKLKLVDGDPQLYYQYKVEGELQEYFEGLGYKFDTEKNDYFLCCYQDT